MGHSRLSRLKADSVGVDRDKTDASLPLVEHFA